MGDMYFVGFSQLRKSAEARFNHGNSFRRGGRSPMSDVGCDNVEKRHLTHWALSAMSADTRIGAVYLPRVRVSREAAQSLSNQGIPIWGNLLGLVRVEELEPLDAIVIPPFRFSRKRDQPVAGERHNLPTFIQQEDVFRALCGIQDWGENGWLGVHGSVQPENCSELLLNHLKHRRIFRRVHATVEQESPGGFGGPTE